MFQNTAKRNYWTTSTKKTTNRQVKRTIDEKSSATITCKAISTNYVTDSTGGIPTMLTGDLSACGAFTFFPMCSWDEVKKGEGP